MSRSSVLADKRATTSTTGNSSETSNGRFPSNPLNQKQSTSSIRPSTTKPIPTMPFTMVLPHSVLLPSSVVEDDGVKITSKTPLQAIELIIYLISMRQVAHFGVSNSKICEHIRSLVFHLQCIKNYLSFGMKQQIIVELENIKAKNLVARCWRKVKNDNGAVFLQQRERFVRDFNLFCEMMEK